MNNAEQLYKLWSQATYSGRNEDEDELGHYIRRMPVPIFPASRLDLETGVLHLKTSAGGAVYRSREKAIVGSDKNLLEWLGKEAWGA